MPIEEEMMKAAAELRADVAVAKERTEEAAVKEHEQARLIALHSELEAAKKRLVAGVMEHSFDKHVDPYVGMTTEEKVMARHKAKEEKEAKEKVEPVVGYAHQTETQRQMVNFVKQEEEKLLRVLDLISNSGTADPRWLAVAKTDIEKGFMALVRSLAKPARIALPGDTFKSPEYSLGNSIVAVQIDPPTSPEPQAPVDYNRDTTTDGETGRTD